MDYLHYRFEDDEAFINTFDEAPLWSASFGLLMFKYLELKPNQTILDIGSGTGFPLLELAGRFGNSCKLYGIDLWKNANKRARQKIKNYELKHVEIIEQSAENIPFEPGFIDLIVSNLGINNFENPEHIFKECNRVLKPQGKLSITTNLHGHWKEFYVILYETLYQLGREDLIGKVREEEKHRGTIDSISQLFTNNGFIISRVFEEQFDMRFLDGTAFLNHHFVKLGWLTTWRRLFPEDSLVEIFSALEKNLNVYAQQVGVLKLSVPAAFIEGEKLSGYFSETIH